jgi:hypothetical protein
MKTKLFFTTGILALALVFGLALTGCETEEETPAATITIGVANNAPVKVANTVTATSEGEFNGVFTWWAANSKADLEAADFNTNASNSSVMTGTTSTTISGVNQEKLLLHMDNVGKYIMATRNTGSDKIRSNIIGPVVQN